MSAAATGIAALLRISPEGVRRLRAAWPDYPSDLVGAEWATTSVTFKAEEELRKLFEHHELPAPRLVLQSQSALTLMISLANTDLLTMVPAQWSTFSAIGALLAQIPVREVFKAPSIVVVRRGELPLTPAAEFLLDLLKRNVPRQTRKCRGGA